MATKIKSKKQAEPESPRLNLLGSRLSSGQTMRELYESWGFRFNAAGYLVSAREPARG